MNIVKYIIHLSLTIGVTFGFFVWLTGHELDNLGQAIGYGFVYFGIPTIVLCVVGLFFKVIILSKVSWYRITLLLLTYSVIWNLYWLIFFSSIDM